MGILSNKMSNFTETDYKVVNNIKSLALDMINISESGHPGIVLSSAPIIYSIYAKHMRFDIKNDKWINRDRFIMSSGHGSALLYATLFMCGFNISIEDLKKFRTFDSITPGHPEYNTTPGVDATTGPLGQGIATAVGISIAEKFLNNRYHISKEKSLIDHYTYVLCGDGDLMEGVSYEACSVAGNLNLGKLIILYDSNNITLDGFTKDTFKENVADRFKAMNFDVNIVKDGTNLDEINNAIIKSKKVKNKPSIIIVKTILGNGSKLQNTNLVHGKPLTAEDLKQLKNKLNIRDIPFTVYEENINYIGNILSVRNVKVLTEWNILLNKYKNKGKYLNEIDNILEGNLSITISDTNFDDELLGETGREISSNILNKIVNDNLLMLGGGCDVASSCKTYLKKMGDFTSTNLNGRNLLFGVREHASGAIANGIVLSGIRVFTSTFLSFSNYMLPAIRMSALMKLPVIYIFTHDSFLIGKDGPTHQPVEQLISLRSIPNVTVYKPFDGHEILGAYKSALSNISGPSIIIISKEKMRLLKTTKVDEVSKGAYIVKKEKKPKGIIIATGYELSIAIEVYKKLKSIGILTNVVSMPSIEKYFEQDLKYQEKILPDIPKVVIEFSSPYSWYRIVKSNKYIFGVSKFGKSASKEDLLKYYKLTIDDIYNKIKKYFI